MICFIILHYLVLEETAVCVNSILDHVKGEKKIIVVDNASPNSSYEKLTQLYQRRINQEEVYILENKCNEGYAKGMNFGYQFAKEVFSPDFIVLMNNDMEILQSDFGDRLIQTYEETKFDCLGPDVYSTSAGIHQNPEKKTMRTIPEIEQKIKFFKKRQKQLPLLYIKGILKNQKIISNLYYKGKKRFLKEDGAYKNQAIGCALHGSCIIYSKKCMNKRDVAFFEKTFFYCEAQILDYECKRDGLLQVYEPKLQVLHHEDCSTNAVYQSYLTKAKFTNECMMHSLLEFQKLLEYDKKTEKMTVKSSIME